MESIPFSLWGDALWCGQEVVREAPHELAIRSLFPDPIPARGADLDTEAELVPEPHSRFDPRAIATLAWNSVPSVSFRSQADGSHSLTHTWHGTLGCRPWLTSPDSTGWYRCASSLGR